ncbi:MAG: helix-turn-helix domain-containing protein [Rubrobacteraceae bacterium]
MIGAKRVAVTRALAELQKSGAVTLRHRQIFIKDTEALERKSRE